MVSPGTEIRGLGLRGAPPAPRSCRVRVAPQPGGRTLSALASLGRGGGPGSVGELCRLLAPRRSRRPLGSRSHLSGVRLGAGRELRLCGGSVQLAALRTSRPIRRPCCAPPGPAHARLDLGCAALSRGSCRNGAEALGQEGGRPRAGPQACCEFLL